jgi:hypothetical protein
MNPTLPPQPERELAVLEREVAAGIKAMALRNSLLVSMVDAGYRQADITRRLNEVRAAVGVEPLTPDAVHATLRRARNPKENR